MSRPISSLVWRRTATDMRMSIDTTTCEVAYRYSGMGSGLPGVWRRVAARLRRKAALLLFRHLPSARLSATQGRGGGGESDGTRPRRGGAGFCGRARPLGQRRGDHDQSAARRGRREFGRPARAAGLGGGLAHSQRSRAGHAPARAPAAGPAAPGAGDPTARPPALPRGAPARLRARPPGRARGCRARTTAGVRPVFNTTSASTLWSRVCIGSGSRAQLGPSSAT
jgi:hypothetical protein